MGFRLIPLYTCDVEGCGERVLLEEKPDKGMALMVGDQEVVDMPVGWMKLFSNDFSGYLCPTHPAGGKITISDEPDMKVGRF